MKKPLTIVLILFGMVTFPSVRGRTEDLFDLKKSQEELEIMKGILNTTLSFAAQRSKGRTTSEASSKQSGLSVQSSWQFANINAFHLAGQGAVFVIPSSSLRRADFAGDTGEISQELSQQTKTYSDAVAAYSSALASLAPASPAPPAPPAASQANHEELRKKVEELQAKMKKNREDAQANRERFLQGLAEIKACLIEALANYGDSLTTVKADQYINLVLITDDEFFGRQPTRYDVISAQKSWIADYKAGRLSLEAFKKRVLNYSE